MDMRWSPRVPVGKAQQFTNRSIIRDRITARLDRPEIDLSVLIGSQPATQVHFGLAGILIFIETVPVRQPDIDQRIGDRRSLAVDQVKRNEQRIAINAWTSNDAAERCKIGRASCRERVCQSVEISVGAV